MKRRLSILVCVLSCWLMPGAPVRAAEEPVRVGVMKDAKPGSWRNEKGELTGFSVEVTRALCKTASLQCQFVEMASLQQLIDAVAGNELDVVAASLLETPERSARMLFTQPYFRSTSYLVARPGMTLDSPGLRVAVQIGSRQMDFIRTRVSGDQQIVAVPTVTELVTVLDQGRADASVMAMIQTIRLIYDAGSARYTITPLNAPELTGDARIAVTRSKPHLRDRLNEALQEIRSNGTLEKINTRHMPFRVI